MIRKKELLERIEELERNMGNIYFTDYTTHTQNY